MRCWWMLKVWRWDNDDAIILDPLRMRITDLTLPFLLNVFARGASLVISVWTQSVTRARLDGFWWYLVRTSCPWSLVQELTSQLLSLDNTDVSDARIREVSPWGRNYSDLESRYDSDLGYHFDLCCNAFGMPLAALVASWSMVDTLVCLSHIDRMSMSEQQEELSPRYFNKSISMTVIGAMFAWFQAAFDAETSGREVVLKSDRVFDYSLC